MKSVQESTTTSSLSSGENTLSSTSADTGTVQKITNVNFKYTGSASGVRFTLKAGGEVVKETYSDPTSEQYVRVTTPLYLSQGEKIDLVVSSASADDSATLVVQGVEMQA